MLKGDAGADALQLMVDLMPFTDPASISYADTNDATNVLLAGRAGTMMNWPFVWNAGSDPKQSKIVGNLRQRGAAGRSRRLGLDRRHRRLDHHQVEHNPTRRASWSSSTSIPRSRSARRWTPAGCRSALGAGRIPSVQAKPPNAAVVLEQAKHPLRQLRHRGLQPGHRRRRHRGAEGLQGQKTAAQAIADAQDQVTASSSVAKAGPTAFVPQERLQPQPSSSAGDAVGLAVVLPALLVPGGGAGLSDRRPSSSALQRVTAERQGDPANLVGFDELQRLLAEDDAFRRAVVNTAYFSAAEVVLVVGISLGVARAADNHPLGRFGLFRMLLIVPWAIAPVANAVLWKWILNANYGVLNARAEGPRPHRPSIRSGSARRSRR